MHQTATTTARSSKDAVFMKTSLLSTVHDTTCMSKPPFALHEVSLAGKHAVIASTDLLTNLSNILLQRQERFQARPGPGHCYNCVLKTIKPRFGQSVDDVKAMAVREYRKTCEAWDVTHTVEPLAYTTLSPTPEASGRTTRGVPPPPRACF